MEGRNSTPKVCISEEFRVTLQDASSIKEKFPIRDNLIDVKVFLVQQQGETQGKRIFVQN